MTLRFPNHLFLRTTLLVFLLTLAVGCNDWEERIVTSPLVGAQRIDERGVSRVEEVLKTKSYAYLRLASAPPGVWHVVSGEAPQLGSTVSYRGYAELLQFHSPSLKRNFERLIFTSTQPKGKTP